MLHDTKVKISIVSGIMCGLLAAIIFGGPSIDTEEMERQELLRQVEESTKFVGRILPQSAELLTISLSNSNTIHVIYKWQDHCWLMVTRSHRSFVAITETSFCPDPEDI